MACNKISYLNASEMSTNLLSLHHSGFSVFCMYFYVFHRWEAACWRCRIKRFCVPDTEWQGLGYSVSSSTLYSKRKAQKQLQVVSPFCKQAVVQPLRDSACSASFNSLHPCHQSPCFPALTYSESTTPQHAHTAVYTPVLQTGSGNQFILKINLLGLRGQSGTEGYIRHPESKG